MSVPSRKTRKTRCGTGKVAFLSQGEANRAIDRVKLTELQAAVHAETFPQRAYRCRCGSWHLTSQEQRTERKARERRERKPSKPRRRKVAAKTRRHLTLAPALPKPKPAAEPKPLPRFSPADPISPARRALWASNEAERRRAEAAARNTSPLRSQAA